jgi:predicted RNase H-like HicB family nuclease
VIREYIQAAMAKAHCELIDQPSDPFCGTIPGFRGVIAIGRTLEECRSNLEDALSDWLVFRLRSDLAVPAIKGLHLMPPLEPKRHAQTRPRLSRRSRAKALKARLQRS